MSAAKELIAAARALIADTHNVARLSHQVWDHETERYVWSDKVWKEAEPEQFAIVERLRAAIAAVEGHAPGAHSGG